MQLAVGVAPAIFAVDVQQYDMCLWHGLHGTLQDAGHCPRLARAGLAENGQVASEQGVGVEIDLQLGMLTVASKMDAVAPEGVEQGRQLIGVDGVDPGAQRGKLVDSPAEAAVAGDIAQGHQLQQGAVAFGPGTHHARQQLRPS